MKKNKNKKKAISHLREKLLEREEELKSIEDNKKCLEMWEKERQSVGTGKKHLNRWLRLTRRKLRKLKRNHIDLCILHFRVWQSFPQRLPSFLANDKTLLPMMCRNQTPPINDQAHLRLHPPLSPVYGDGAAGGMNDDVTSTSSLGSASFSPIANRTHQHQQQGEVITAPMINVMGPTGPALVYRPWTDADMTEALNHLPNPTELWHSICRPV